MTKLWRVDVQLEYTVVVSADSAEIAREVAQDHYRDSVDPEEWVHETEITGPRDVPEGWGDSVPYAEDESALHDHMVALEEAAGLDVGEQTAEPTVDRLLWLAEEVARRTPQRCPNTPDMFNLPNGQQK